MKKSLIALAVAGAMTAPMIAQADATLYGVAQFRLVDADGASLDAQMAKTRLGVKGTVDNDIDGLTTGFQFEWEFSGNATNATTLNSANPATTGGSAVTMRKSNVYMKGDFGNVVFGLQNNPVNAVETASVMGRNDNSDVSDRVSNSIVYYSPKMNGLDLYLGLIVDANSAADVSAADDEDLDGTAAGINYSANGLTVALGYQTLEMATGTEDIDTLGLGVSYDMNGLYLAAQTVEKDFGATDTRDNSYAVKYAIDKTSLRAQYNDNSATNTDTLVLGAWYSLGSKASVGVEYMDHDAANSDELVLEYTLSF